MEKHQDQVIEQTVNRIVELFHPSRVIEYNTKYDMDGNISAFKLCIVGDIPDKRRMLTRIFDEVDSDIPYDVLVDGHNLTWLCRQAKKYDKGFHQWFDESADLNQCYVETRYPADIEREYTYKMVKNFYRMAKEMYQYIFAEIDREFDRREKAEEDAPFYRP